ncbi:unnamed protein product [Parascedosporium putredinis]|uniref:Uncharacterized protein n=1 Tax=Parascedosporium putredinis TaxID=1442378 RepID=A0A9P1H2V3_9PEZI|nr:unnamed protein product [Parascedosporium putredinis]CAI7995169.1 unnamed protein product [Parascedosporium putredinis]
MGLTTFYKLVPFVLSTLIAILLIVVLVAGSSPSTLPNLYLLKVNTTNLHLPSKLSESRYLADLSKVTGTDLTGQTFDAATLGIAELYTIHIFTCCAQPDRCTAPVLGPSFDPVLHLRLGIGAVDSLPAPLEDALSLYKRVSPMLGTVFILAFVLVLSAPSITLLNRRVFIAGWLAMSLAGLSAVLLLIGCIAGRVTAQRLVQSLNESFSDELGITAEEGGLLLPAWAAIPVCFANTLLIFIRSKKEDDARTRLVDKEKKTRESSEERGGPGDDDRSNSDDGNHHQYPRHNHHHHASGGLFDQGSDPRHSSFTAEDSTQIEHPAPVVSRRARGSLSENRSVRYRDPDAWYVNYRGVQTGR